MRTALLISGFVVAGCVGGEPDQREVPSSTVEAAIGGDNPRWMPDQGTHILGSGPDAIPNQNGYVRVSTVPTFRTRFTLSVAAASDGAHLVATSDTETHEKDDAWFDHLILTASSGGQIMITGMTEVTAADLEFLYVASTAPSTLYTLSYRAPDAKGGFGAWEDYCDGHGGAVALRGAYNAKRAHVDPVPGAISFACTNGIAYKCVMWGYGSGNDSTSQPWRYHQACTAAGNARYCGDEHSFTRELTPIRIIDDRAGFGIDDPGPTLGHPSPSRTSPDAWPGAPDTVYIESGWNGRGEPICLSKLRWVSLPPDPCSSVLKDPRLPPVDPEVFFCDQLSASDLIARGAKLVVGSRMMDAPMQRWRKPNGDTVSTIRGFAIDRVAPFGAADADSYFPFPDSAGNSVYTTYVGLDGMLLRNLPGSLTESQMLPLFRQGTTGSDRYVTDAPGLDRSDPSFEGYAFAHQVTITSESSSVRDLAQYNECTWNATDHDNRRDGTAASVNCANVKSLGFALPAP